MTRSLFVQLARYGDQDTTILTLEDGSVIYRAFIPARHRLGIRGQALRIIRYARKCGIELVQVDPHGMGAGLVDIITELAPKGIQLAGSLIHSEALHPDEEELKA